MFGYYLGLALRSLKRDKTLTVLILAIAHVRAILEQNLGIIKVSTRAAPCV